ncbi:class I SAM-dependent methyltransferase [Desulfocurvus sp. DL9XJH121]
MNGESGMNDIRLDAPLDELLDMARSRYEVCFEPVAVDGVSLEILQIADMAKYVERLAEGAAKDGLDLPFWARIWPASLLLAHTIGSLPADRDTELLEIGAGVGICGLTAAARGIRATITDINPDALLFSRINILHNGLGGLAEARKADFAADRLGKRFQYIYGAEVLYIEKLHRGLVKFLGAHLRPEDKAEVIISRDWKRKSIRFFKLAEEEFHLDRRTIGCKATDGGETERYLCEIIRLKPRKKVTP